MSPIRNGTMCSIAKCVPRKSGQILKISRQLCYHKHRRHFFGATRRDFVLKPSPDTQGIVISEVDSPGGEPRARASRATQLWGEEIVLGGGTPVTMACVFHGVCDSRCDHRNSRCDHREEDVCWSTLTFKVGTLRQAVHISVDASCCSSVYAHQCFSPPLHACSKRPRTHRETGSSLEIVKLGKHTPRDY